MRDLEAPALRVRGLTKRWPRLPAPVLDEVDLELPAGQTIWIGGGNGAGKTTLLRIVAGIVDPDAGSVEAAGHDVLVDRRAARARIAFLPAASTGLYARLSVRQHLELWVRLAWVPFEQRDQAVATAVEDFGLAALVEARADRMSMGQRQRVRLAMTFMADTSLVLLDEPATSLDRNGLAVLGHAVDRAVARGATVIWCSPTDDAATIGPDARYEVRAGRLDEIGLVASAS
jgi:ABC-2 type transport system ATP-binding protein